MAAISDSSPLILYARVDQLDLLSAVYGEILVTSAVWNEVVTAGSSRPGAAELLGASWIRRRDSRTAGEQFGLLTKLDDGEASALALALELRGLGGRLPVILDDRKARRAAAQLGLTVIGSAGVLVLAKDLGLVPRVKPVLDDLRNVGLYPSDRAEHELLQLAGEAQSMD